jgi:hypothetical protein
MISHTKPVVYRGHVINVRIEGGKYIFMIRRTIALDLMGIADNLSEAFEKARAMIDKLED